MIKKKNAFLSEDEIFDRLRTILDPETNINIVDMGFIRAVQILEKKEQAEKLQIHILYTLTTPGCPLAGTLQGMMYAAFEDLQLNGFVPEEDLVLELTFDPPWTLDSMSEEAKAELGF
jgi:metal-sulfur cluster biosynthetic enzyme